MTEIYLRDDTYARNGCTGPRLTTENVKSILDDVRSRQPFFIHQIDRGCGFILKFRNESDVNYILSYRIFDQLQERNLTASLSKDARFHRELKIYDIPNTIYDERNSDIIKELERENNVKVLSLTAYRPEHSTRNFFKIILDSRSAKEAIIERGIIYLFRARLHVSNSCPPPPDRRRPSNDNPPQSHPTGQPAAPAASSVAAPPAQVLPAATSTLPRQNVWANQPPQQQHTSTTGNSTMPNDQAPQEHLLYSDIYLNAFDIMSNRLSKGHENPDIYVYIFNQLLVNNGYPEINIPKDILIKISNNSNQQTTATNLSPVSSSNSTNNHSTPVAQTPPPQSAW